MRSDLGEALYRNGQQRYFFEPMLLTVSDSEAAESEIIFSTFLNDSFYCGTVLTQMHPMDALIALTHDHGYLSGVPMPETAKGVGGEVFRPLAGQIHCPPTVPERFTPLRRAVLEQDLARSPEAIGRFPFSRHYPDLGSMVDCGEAHTADLVAVLGTLVEDRGGFVFAVLLDWEGEAYFGLVRTGISLLEAESMHHAGSVCIDFVATDTVHEVRGTGMKFTLLEGEMRRL